MEKLLENLEKYLLYATVFLFPIFAVSISQNPYVVPKLALLTYGVGIILLLRAIRVLTSGKLDFSSASFDFPVLLLGVAFIASTILRTPNKMEALVLPGTTTAVLAGILLYFLVNQHGQSVKQGVLKALIASAGIFALLTILSFSGMGDGLSFWPSFLRAPSFSTEGGFLPVVIFLGAILPSSVSLLLTVKNPAGKLLFGIVAALVAFGFLLGVYNILPGRPYSPRFPSLGTSWSIAIDSLKQSPVLGVGPGNYLTAFNRFRPIAYNASDLWAVKFATASNFYLTTITETGLFGLAALALTLFSVYRFLKIRLWERKTSGLPLGEGLILVSLVALALAFALFPVTLLVIVTWFIFLALAAKTHASTLNLTTQAPASEMGIPQTGRQVTSRLPAILVTLPVFIFLIWAGVRGGRILLAEYRFKKSLDSLSQNKGSETYELMRQAISLNPQIDRYHAAFTRVNLALANSLAQKGDALTDQDRTLIGQLIQQAIRDARATVILNTQRAGNWEILGSVYRSIIPLAQGADEFSLQSYSQAVALDPINPSLRIALGGLYYAKDDFDTAVRVLELAVISKPDHANAHYNLAFAYRDQGEIDKAIQQMTLVLSLIQNKESQDYLTAKAALEDMESRRTSAAEGADTLTPPQGESTVPPLEPPLELPEESQPPPTGAVTPTPSPTPNP